MSFTQAERMQYIGGSDIAAVLGQSRWKTPYRLWAEKTGKIIVPDLSSNEAVEMGNRLEQLVADIFSEKTEKTVRRAPKMYRHSEYPFLVANIDRLIVGGDELLECKTCSAYKLEEWENKIPREYVLQVIWYLGITGRKRGWIACLIGGQKFDYKPIDFDQELFDLMVEKALKFWDMVQNDVPPMILPEDDTTLAELYPTHTEDLIEIQEMNDRIAYLQEIKMHIEEMTKEKREIETELKTLIKDKAGVITDRYKITWKAQTSKRIDSEALKADCPDIAQKYMKESVSRVLRINKRKEKEECKR
jgi:putative phage-type endonuclease